MDIDGELHCQRPAECTQ